MRVAGDERLQQARQRQEEELARRIEAADGRPDSMPQLADIRDTSSVEDDSDIVVFGHREFKNHHFLKILYVQK